MGDILGLYGLKTCFLIRFLSVQFPAVNRQIHHKKLEEKAKSGKLIPEIAVAILEC